MVRDGFALEAWFKALGATKKRVAYGAGAGFDWLRCKTIITAKYYS